MKLLIMADVHSNLGALHAILSAHFQKAVVAGDIVGYGPEPNECIGMLASLKIPCVMGNHDHACVSNELEGFNVFAAAAVKWTQERLTRESKVFLANLPRQLKFELDGKKFLVVHGSPREPLSEYLTEDFPETVLSVFLKGADVLIVGHTHRPWIRKISGKLAINAGSVGQPRDGNPAAAAVVLDTKTLKAEIIRKPYDVRSCQAKMKGLPAILAERLELGW